MTRYSRQTAVSEIGPKGQERLRRSAIAIVGVGGLGSAAAELLCRAGVGTITIIEDDVVELSNLQRQSLYNEKDIGKQKAEAAAARLSTINSETKIIALNERITAANTNILDDADLILDCTDNIKTRLLLNAHAVKRKIPFIFCSAQGTNGMLSVVDPRAPGRACFACVFGKLAAFAPPAKTGVLNTTVHLAATLQVIEALKILVGKRPTDGLISVNTWDLKIETFVMKKNPACEVCGKKKKTTQKKVVTNKKQKRINRT